MQLQQECEIRGNSNTKIPSTLHDQEYSRATLIVKNIKYPPLRFLHILETKKPLKSGAF